MLLLGRFEFDRSDGWRVLLLPLEALGSASEASLGICFREWVGELGVHGFEIDGSGTAIAP